jgi:hypothetical protein
MIAFSCGLCSLSSLRYVASSSGSLDAALSWENDQHQAKARAGRTIDNEEILHKLPHHAPQCVRDASLDGTGEVLRPLGRERLIIYEAQ